MFLVLYSNGFISVSLSLYIRLSSNILYIDFPYFIIGVLKMDKAETGRSTPCDNKVLCTVDCVVNSVRKFRRFEAVVKKWCCRKWAVQFY